MASYADLLDDVRGAAYGAPDPILERSVRRAAQQLCQYSQCWQEWLTPARLRDGVARYELGAPFGASVERVITVKVDGRPICQQMRAQDLAAVRDRTGSPRVWAHAAMEPDLILWPAPDADHAELPLEVYAAIAPTADSTGIPNDLARKHGPALAAYAKWDLLANSPEQPWHNPNNASVHKELADELFTRAKRALHSGHSMPLTVAPRRFI